MITKRLLTHIEREGFFQDHHRVLIAVSGGVDSMNLLHFLHTHQKKLAIEIGIAHVNHQQRPESYEEEYYLNQWAKQSGVPFFSKRFIGHFSEAKARDFRYHFFKEVMETNGYTALVTAHHQDDQVETIMMRLLRGSLWRHLTGILPVQPFGPGELIRPLLPFSKKEFPDCFHFEDSSNVSLTYLRNRVRHRYLPLLTQENPAFSNYLLQLSQDMCTLNQALSDLISDLDYQYLSVFKSQTPAVQDIMLQDYLSTFPDLHLSRAQFNDVKQILNQDKSYYHHLKSGYMLNKSETSFSIESVNLENKVFDEEITLVYGETVRVEDYELSFCNHFDERNSISLDSTAPILLRHRRPGDSISFETHTKKLRRLFIDDKVPREQRQHAIVGEQDGKIIFVLTDNKTYLRKVAKHDIMKAKLYIQKH